MSQWEIYDNITNKTHDTLEAPYAEGAMRLFLTALYGPPTEERHWSTGASTYVFPGGVVASCREGKVSVVGSTGKPSALSVRLKQL